MRNKYNKSTSFLGFAREKPHGKLFAAPSLFQGRTSRPVLSRHYPNFLFRLIFFRRREQPRGPSHPVVFQAREKVPVPTSLIFPVPGPSACVAGGLSPVIFDGMPRPLLTGRPVNGSGTPIQTHGFLKKSRDVFGYAPHLEQYMINGCNRRNYVLPEK